MSKRKLSNEEFPRDEHFHPPNLPVFHFSPRSHNLLLLLEQDNPGFNRSPPQMDGPYELAASTREILDFSSRNNLEATGRCSSGIWGSPTENVETNVTLGTFTANVETPGCSYEFSSSPEFKTLSPLRPPPISPSAENNAQIEEPINFERLCEMLRPRSHTSNTSQVLVSEPSRYFVNYEMPPFGGVSMSRVSVPEITSYSSTSEGVGVPVYIRDRFGSLVPQTSSYSSFFDGVGLASFPASDSSGVLALQSSSHSKTFESAELYSIVEEKAIETESPEPLKAGCLEEYREGLRKEKQELINYPVQKRYLNFHEAFIGGASSDVSGIGQHIPISPSFNEANATGILRRGRRLDGSYELEAGILESSSENFKESRIFHPVILKSSTENAEKARRVPPGMPEFSTSNLEALGTSPVFPWSPGFKLISPLRSPSIYNSVENTKQLKFERASKIFRSSSNESNMSQVLVSEPSSDIKYFLSSDVSSSGNSGILGLSVPDIPSRSSNSSDVEVQSNVSDMFGSLVSQPSSHSSYFDDVGLASFRASDNSGVSASQSSSCSRPFEDAELDSTVEQKVTSCGLLKDPSQNSGGFEESSESLHKEKKETFIYPVVKKRYLSFQEALSIPAASNDGIGAGQQIPTLPSSNKANEKGRRRKAHPIKDRGLKKITD